MKPLSGDNESCLIFDTVVPFLLPGFAVQKIKSMNGSSLI